MRDVQQHAAGKLWRLCGRASEGCRGAAVDPNDECWEHLSPRLRKSALSRLEPGSRVDARGTNISSEVFDEILARLRSDNGAVRLGLARFDYAKFFTPVELERAEFIGPAGFYHAEFTGPARFEHVTFSRGAGFGEACFLGSARFGSATFEGPARFQSASFMGPAWFGATRFFGPTEFDETTFTEEAGFTGAEFSDSASFSKARFEGFTRTQRVKFSGDARFDNVVFVKDQRLGPLVVSGSLNLEETTFAQRLELETTAGSLVCVRTHFSDRVVLRFSGGDVALEAVEFPRPARLEPQQIGQRFRLVSLRRTDATNLVLAGVDLSACQFAGAHNLDKLRIENANAFASTPRGLKTGPILGHGPPLWRWTRRQTLAEEHRLRGDRPRRWFGQRTPYPDPAAKRRGWYPSTSQPPRWLTTQRPPSDDELITLYRSLRKAREDSKDEPGAADFYFGEMEMRRLADQTPWAERLILDIYWLVSGYSLRGLRAVLALVVVILGVATLLHHVGFHEMQPTPGSWRSVLYATKSTLSIPVTEQLTSWGEALRIILRLTGPILLGLALLSVRNRVKR